MKRTALLNRHLSLLVASLGHLDEIVVADAGLPVPAGVKVIDLAVTAGVPSFRELLTALKSELVIEGAVWAEEASAELTSLMQHEVAAWAEETGKAITVSRLSHEAFKHRTQTARAVIRTGEVTPYANIILISGVAF
ncbi:ribose pyranase [Labrenzia sp. CP4]|jgi:D-ribose pyranase|uniref:D-ribose pyranase n=1 Tax=Stappiaceae TaxID=2821832 RepID=UPI00078244A8|nr:MULTISPECIES: D-ribose pyranase [Stappiaceae]AMN54103.1 ribose pyranase [Labrenzia sp. CP4]MBN8180400.1 D-ribose pyranase [Roseibium aggregatum]UES45472.1 D-ribose pyranase [Roseibium aggregatum]